MIRLNSNSRSLGPCRLWFTAIFPAAFAALMLSFGQSQAPATAAPGIKVQGNQLVTTRAGTLGVQSVGAGVPVVLRGVNFSGSQSACLKGRFWGNQPGNQATINAMLTWHANAMRLPLNEDCWLGLNGMPAASSGANYQTAMGSFVNLAVASGLIVEVDLHYGAGGKAVPTSDDYPALDADHAPAFWQSVADYFKGNPAVIFNLINEPLAQTLDHGHSSALLTKPTHGAFLFTSRSKVRKWPSQSSGRPTNPPSPRCHRGG